MRTFFADIIPKIQRFSKRLDDLTKLRNQHWVSLGDINHSKRVFIFRPNNQLLISENGIVEKSSWEYLGNQSLLLDMKDESYLLKHGFFDENVIALKLGSTDRYTFFINETKYNQELNNIDDVLQFLTQKYLKKGGTLKGTKKPGGNINENVSYKITSEKDKFDIITGSIKVYQIEFSNGRKGNVYYGYSLKTHYYYSETGRVHIKTLEEAIAELLSGLKNNP